MRDGDQVTYVGFGSGPEYGDQGRVLQRTGSYSHVQWLTGPQRGRVEIYDNADLETVASRRNSDSSIASSLDDSLEVAASMVDTYEEGGGHGLAVHLASTGYLAAYSSVAEDVLQQVTAVLQQDPVLHQLTAQMDPEESEEVYRQAARMLLSDSGGF